MRKALLAAALGTLAACSDATSPSIGSSKPAPRLSIAPGNNTVVVTESSIARQAENTSPSRNWVFYVRNAGTGAFRLGPGTPPLGSGSFEISTPTGTDKGFLFNFDHVGVALSSITSISYSTYISTPGTADARQAPSINIVIDKNGGSYVAGDYATVVFEPVYNGTVTAGTWQSWDAISSGNALWWVSVPGGGTSLCPPAYTFCTWNDVLTKYPGATILGGFGVNQGSGNGGLVSSVDALSIGYGGNSVTYDFEDTSCHFTDDGTTRNLDGDCVTTETIRVPDGWTLDGNGHTITAMDPNGGHFLGAVIRNDGASANVTNLTITASGLSDACDDGDNRLRGILLEDAAGSITNNVVTGVRQGLSGCQEGNSIEARNFSSPTKRLVTISGNTVTNYQKTGIVTNGTLNATISGNTVTGDGPITYTAQNGIQVGFGATAVVKNNTASGNSYTPKAWTACGLLLYQADGVKASANNLFNNEINQCNAGKGGGNVKAFN